MRKQQKTYTREFKMEAVQLVKGKPMSQVARDLGISDSALFLLSKQFSTRQVYHSL